ncbi:hypothetical protein CRUP_000705 [Coryphaenoides rupestris]|nr:hypothetical protein CRUP_000705 [Coryphaenoides rupestris]
MRAAPVTAKCNSAVILPPGLTCLHVATLNGHHQLVQQLMKKGADLNIQEGTSGKTALHLAVEQHDVRLVALLLTQSADVDAAMFNGCTPLHLAVGRQDATVAHLLCQANADKMVRNTENETPLDLADGNDDWGEHIWCGHSGGLFNRYVVIIDTYNTKTMRLEWVWGSSREKPEESRAVSNSRMTRSFTALSFLSTSAFCRRPMVELSLRACAFMMRSMLAVQP